MDPTIKVWCLQALKGLIFVLDYFTDLLFGHSLSHGPRADRDLARKSFEHSAQLVSVLAKATHTPAWPVDVTTTHVFRHVKYVNPRTILENENICLSHLSSTHAYFGVARAGVDFYDTKKYPFLSPAIINGADRFIILPISAFHRLAEEAGDPKVNVVMIPITIRCGSTLLAQIMNRVPKTRSLSEPTSLNWPMVLHHWKKIDIVEARALMRSALRLLVKVEPSADIQRVSIKMDSYGQIFIGMIHEMFPKITFVLSTRHPVPSVKSFRKLFAVFGETESMMSIYMRLGLFWRLQLQPVCYPLMDKYASEMARLNPLWQTIPDDEVAAMWYTACLAGFNEFRHAFKDTILYEDLVSDPEAVVGRLFRLLGIDEEHVAIGVSALNLDSQNNITNVKIQQKITPELKSAVDRCLRNAHLPISSDTSVNDFRKFLEIPKKEKEQFEPDPFSTSPN